MTNNYFRKLNIPKDFIKFEYFYNEIKQVEERCYCGSAYWPAKWGQDHLMFSEKFKDFLKAKNVKVLKAEAFIVYPKTSLAWHNDTNDELSDLDYHETSKINFMWGNLDQCFMEYGELTSPLGRKIVENRRGRKAYVYDPEYVKIIERFSLELPVLINRGPTHRVTNESSFPWYCLSCILLDSKSEKSIDFSDALSRFNEYVVD
jgi:hypothetical protein